MPLQNMQNHLYKHLPIIHSAVVLKVYAIEQSGELHIMRKMTIFNII